MCNSETDKKCNSETDTSLFFHLISKEHMNLKCTVEQRLSLINVIL